MTVEPGDLIIGDDDGILAVPLDSAEDIYSAAHAKHEQELQSAIKHAAGTSDRTKTRAKLISMGAEFEA
jgi:regulator of RNase E activity RraA